MPFGGGPILPYIPRAAEGEDEDPALAQVLQLIGQLELGQPGQPPAAYKPPGPLRRTVGSLGDAILAMAAVRAGGGPPPIGPFAATEQQKQDIAMAQAQEFEKRQRENEAANRTLRNTVRIGAFEEKQRREREESVAKIRLQGQKDRQLAPQSAFVIDEAGNTYFAAVPRIAGGGLGETVEYHGLNPGAPETPVGKLRPASQSLRIQELLGGLAGINPQTLGVTPIEAPGGGGRAQPKPTTEETRRASFLTALQDSFATLRNVGGEFAKKKPGPVGTIIKQLGRQIGGEAGRSAIGLIDPQLETFQSTKELIGEQLAFLVTGQQMSEQQAQRLINQLPSAALLTTEEGRKTYNALAAKAERLFLTMLKTNVKASPGLFTPEQIQEIEAAQLPEVTTEPTQPTSVDDILKEYDERKQGANPTP